MQENSFTADTRFYRQSLPEFLTPTDSPDVYQLSANPDPSEAVVDIYGEGNVGLAVHMGPGLAFTDSRDNEWLDPERVGIEIRLQDVLDQGGLVYTVESIITSTVWYFTLPSGSVQVRKVA
jgi:hypothetical protein